MRWKTKEVVVVAMIGAVMGVVYTLLDYAYMPMQAVLGTVFMEITFGIYMLSAALPMYIVRKPGAAVFGALVTAGVNLLLGSPYGIQLILAGLLEAVGVEIAYLIGGRYKGNMVNMVVGEVLGSIFVLLRDIIVFGYLSLGPAIFIGLVVVRLLSAIIIGILIIRLVTAALVKTGVLKGFACAK